METHSHASRRDGRESPCPSRTHGEVLPPRSSLFPAPCCPGCRVVCRYDEKCSESRRERPYGSVAPRDAHDHLPCKGAERSLGPSEALDLLFYDVVRFS
ncbi:hypothetical protein CRG98_008640 [Punica granatum]|uniref:Uncharacterized protein n=1 Tax=Punica granatum TaxID=22663 RepID=A0A2I0KSZ7_PUNGR|nr:hypothetical protein CRG98_008640 [Punica granatum]